ncbi:kinase-like protein [Rickenella mellea]|uniref:Kinase-like protein n=1 Tax=Rickenella mellea TaxID=50990 RepID=A0A4Y7QHR6_9AGAM|nr:kinase-like protein [Rickenella mellea]
MPAGTHLISQASASLSHWMGLALSASDHSGDVCSDWELLDGPYVYLDTGAPNTPADSLHLPDPVAVTLDRNPGKILDDILTKLAHLNLSGKVTMEANAHPKKCGRYTDVYEGSLDADNTMVAIRQLRPSLFKDEDELKKRIALELRIWSELSHPNILQLMGYSLDFGPKPINPAFVTVWMINGNVLDYLKQNQNADRLKMIQGIAKGLRYLHSKGVIHSDLKCENILVSNNPEGTPLLMDFGLSRLLEISQKILSSREGGGTCRWMAIELLQTQLGVSTSATKESDVWAFGMTGFEILAGEPPYAQHKNDGAVILAIVSKEIPRKPEICKGDGAVLWDIFVQCWNPYPSKRPSMSEVSGMMKGLTSEGFYELSISWLPLGIIAAENDDMNYPSVLSGCPSLTMDSQGAVAVISGGCPASQPKSDFQFSSHSVTNGGEHSDSPARSPRFQTTLSGRSSSSPLPLRDPRSYSSPISTSRLTSRAASPESISSTEQCSYAECRIQVVSDSESSILSFSGRSASLHSATVACAEDRR